jgi:hypothetical protein
MYSKTTLLIALFFIGLSEVANAYSDWRHIEGLPCEEVVERLSGITCGFKTTSCPDQLACAIKEVMNK